MIALLSCLKIVIASSIFFVWVIRYDNIIKEFKEYNLPDSLRDFVGILKLSFAFMLMNSNNMIVSIGAIGIAVLMLAAVITHVRVSNPFFKMIPSLCLLVLSGFIASQSLV